jgi:hypothetical protein
MIPIIKNSSTDCLAIDQHNDFIRQLNRRCADWSWRQSSSDTLVTKALKGSSIAALSLSSREAPSRHVFYQDPNLHVRDHYTDPSRKGDEWILGERVLALSLSMNESSLHCRFPGLWHTTTWNARNSRTSLW